MSEHPEHPRDTTRSRDRARPGQTVAELGEFPVIDRAVRGRSQPPTTLVGPGHDAAVVAAPDGRVVCSTDVLVEQRHFRLDWSTPEQVGRKAAAQNGADVAALGAVPTAFVVGIGCPPDTPAAVIEGISAGLGEAAEAIGAGVVGGDLVQAREIVVSVTVLGDLAGRAPLLRDAARAGDVVALAGRVGRSAAGLALLAADARSGPGDLDPALLDLIEVHRVPRPPYDAGPRAADAGAGAASDVSDGLVADVGHIATASGVAIVLDRDALEPPPDLVEAARVVGVDPWQWVLGGGEDHALVATFGPDIALPDGWRPIGRVVDGAGVRVGDDAWSGVPGWQSFEA